MNIWEDKMWENMMETIASIKKYTNGTRQRKSCFKHTFFWSTYFIYL